MPLRHRLNRLDRDHPILKLMAVNGLAGAAAAVVFVTGLLSLDVGGIGSLVAGSSAPVLPVALMMAAFVISLSGVAMATAIMRIGRDEDERGSRGTMIPIRIRADEGGRRRR